MRLSIVAVLGSVALSACATPASPPPAPPPTAGMVRTISYETSGCFGACPVYTLIVSSDGRGIFKGQQHTAVTGTREFAVTAEQFAAFESRLAPFRPAGERRLSTGPECGGRVATDLPSVEVVWSGKGPVSSLYAYFGCNMEANRAMFDALRAAPEAIPQVRELIGGR